MRRLVRLLAGLLAVLCLAGQARAFETRTPFFAGKRVLVLVPHQDDELNLVGGVPEQYVRAGSEIYLAFSTNGDYNGLAEERSREALAVANSLGIPADHVIYLGYGNQWQARDCGSHIYFADDGAQLWTSHIGETATYGTASIGVWRKSAYTRDNFLRDLTDLILTLRPDVIYCSDYDAHHDHMALDLLFEEALGNILARETGYHPTVFKGFCYGTAWYAPADFVGEENLLSCLHPVWDHWDRLGICYDWDARVRLPMSDDNLSRLLSQTQLFQSVGLYRSQDGHRYAESILSGDRVFWQRRTEGLLYAAAIAADGAPTDVLNDFKLKDSENFSALVNTGVCRAETVTVNLPRTAELTELCFYDDPSPEDNILGGWVEFTDGSRVDFGPLDPGGWESRVEFSGRTVEGFTVHVTEADGAAGLTELEAYGSQPQLPLLILMPMDEAGNFVYDYRTPETGELALSLYSWPAGTLWTEVEIDLEGDGTWTLEDGRLVISCPIGQRGDFTITGPGGVRTTFSVSNPHPLIRRVTALWQQLDRDVMMAVLDQT